MLQKYLYLEYVPFVVLPLNILLTALLHRALVVQSGNIRNKKFIEISTYIAFVTVLALSAVSAAYWLENTRFYLALNLTWMTICIILLCVSRKFRRIAQTIEVGTTTGDHVPFSQNQYNQSTSPWAEDSSITEELEKSHTRKRKPGSKQAKNNLSVYRGKKNV